MDRLVDANVIPKKTNNYKEELNLKFKKKMPTTALTHLEFCVFVFFVVVVVWFAKYVSIYDFSLFLVLAFVLPTYAFHKPRCSNKKSSESIRRVCFRFYFLTTSSILPMRSLKKNYR